MTRSQVAAPLGSVTDAEADAEAEEGKGEKDTGEPGSVELLTGGMVGLEGRRLRVPREMYSTRCSDTTADSAQPTATMVSLSATTAIEARATDLVCLSGGGIVMGGGASGDAACFVVKPPRMLPLLPVRARGRQAAGGGWISSRPVGARPTAQMRARPSWKVAARSCVESRKLRLWSALSSCGSCMPASPAIPRELRVEGPIPVSTVGLEDLEGVEGAARASVVVKGAGTQPLPPPLLLYVGEAGSEDKEAEEVEVGVDGLAGVQGRRGSARERVRT